MTHGLGQRPDGDLHEAMKPKTKPLRLMNANPCVRPWNIDSSVVGSFRNSLVAIVFRSKTRRRGPRSWPEHQYGGIGRRALYPLDQEVLGRRGQKIPQRGLVWPAPAE